MLRPLLIIFVYLLVVPILGASAPLEEVEEMVQQGQYSTAWAYLHQRAEDLPYNDFAVKKVELALDYYYRTAMHSLFSFQDLEEGQTLFEVRQQEGGEEAFSLVDPPGLLEGAMIDYPQDHRLYYWLGRYYQDLLLIYGSQAPFPEEELLELAGENFYKALSLGGRNVELYTSLGFIELQRKNYNQAIRLYEEVLTLGEASPRVYHNLGNAYAEIGGAEAVQRALGYLQKSIDLYEPSSSYKAKALNTAAHLSITRGEYGEAIDYTLQAMAIEGEGYYYYDTLLRLYVIRGDYPRARAIGGRMFAYAPHSSENGMTILQVYFDGQALAEALAFFQSELAQYQGDPLSRGNLRFHSAIAQRYLGRYEEAKKSYQRARQDFEKIDGTDSPIFEVIANELVELEGLIYQGE